MDTSQMKRMAVDAMVKYADNEEVYQLAKALEDAATQVETYRENQEAEHAFA